MTLLNSFNVHRGLPAGRYKLSEIFSGLEEARPLKKFIRNRSLLRRLLKDTDVTLTEDGTHYMHVNAQDGSLVIGLEYLNDADERYLYLDIIHELIHLKQHSDGRKLFDEEYDYADRPTEIEAYRYTVDEGRRLGMTEEEITEYLYVEWMTQKEFVRMLKTLGVAAPKG
jgi:hypothetical protein